MDDRDLEHVLADVGAHLDHAVPARLADRVRADIAAERARRETRRRRFSLMPVAVTAALLVLVIAVASPQVRALAQEIFHLRGVDIFRTPATPTAIPTPSSGLGDRGAIFEGRRVSLDDARRSVGFPILVPGALGEPDEVYVSAIPAGDRVVLVYLAAPDRPVSSLPGVSTVVVEMRADIDGSFIGKTVGPGTRVEDVVVNGGTGFWLSGEPHFFFYRYGSGDVRQETLRLSGNTLLWEEGALTLRIEADVALGEALRIARSLR